MTKETLRSLFIVLSGITFVFAFVLFGVLLRGGFTPKTLTGLSPVTKIPDTKEASQTSFKKEVPPSVPTLERAFGQLTESGLRGISGEKDRLGLTLSDYELALPQTLPALIGSEKVFQLVFEDTNFDYTKFLGNCVEIGYVPVRDEDIKSKNDLKAYGLYPVVVWEVNILERSKCAIYTGGTPTTAQTTFKGKLARFERPSPDIGYDYKLVLDSPYIDTENASGMDQKVSFLILVPRSVEVWDHIEKNMSKTVSVTGNFEWGYAESKYFLVSKIF